MNLQYTHIIYPAKYEPKETRTLEIKTVYDTVCRYFGIADISVKCREKELAYARHMYCFFSRKRTTATLRSIASLIGGRDHTTVIHANNTLKDWFDTDENVRKDVMNIENILNR